MDANDKKTTQRLTVTCYDTDVAHYLKPGAFMDMAQEIAYVSAQSLGFGYEDLERFGTAWVLSRMHIEFPRCRAGKMSSSCRPGTRASRGRSMSANSG